MNTELHFSSKSDEWSTPQDLFDKLSEEFGGFDLDVCATPENAKCRYFWTREDDALQQTWGNRGGFTTFWMNPPYSELKDWLKKAFESAQIGSTVVALIPSRTDTRAWHEYVMKASEIRFIQGRLKFSGHKDSAPFPSAIVIFRPNCQGPPNVLTARYKKSNPKDS